MTLNYVVPAVRLNKHQDLQQIVAQLLKELPAGHNDDVEVAIFLDGMHGFTLDKKVTVKDKSYPVRFRDPEDVFNRPTGWVTLTYSQGVFESYSPKQQVESTGSDALTDQYG